MVPVGDSEFPVYIPAPLRPTARRQFKRDARTAQRKARIAGNQATLAYTLGGTIGGALVTGGLVAVVTASGPVGLAGIVVIGIGAIISTGGIWVAHKISNIRARYEELSDNFRDLAGELT